MCCSNHNQGSEHARTAHTFATCIVSIDPVYLLCSCTLWTARVTFVDTEFIVKLLRFEAGLSQHLSQ